MSISAIILSIKNLAFKSQMQLVKKNKGFGRCFAFKGSVVALDKASKIEVNKGLFCLNAKWHDKDPFTSFLSMGSNSSLFVRGSFRIYSNSRISIEENGSLILGSGYINSNLNLACYNSITIGFGVAISENVTIRDSDNHQILSTDHIISDPIVVGNHVWIGMNVTILKGVKIGDGSIIGAGTVLTRDVPENSLVVGVPGRVIKRNVVWK